MKRLVAHSRAWGLVFTLILPAGILHAQSSTGKFVSFKDFIADVAAQSIAPPGNQSKDAASFAEMRQYVLGMYQGVQVGHSFVKESSTFDCIPIQQQPSVRLLGLPSVAVAPPLAMLASQAASSAAAGFMPVASASQIDASHPSDAFGNMTGCAERTIPMRRITLEELTQFPTLSQFLQKGPGGTGQPIAPGLSAGSSAPAAVAPSHKYAVTYQYVNSWGGNSNTNLWSPRVATNLGEIFSLSQEWYVGGSGASLQTAEVGWQNYPAKYGSQSSRLFIYWTADGYSRTGCYNLDCPAFVQVSRVATLGAPFTNYSVPGGTQYEFAAEYYLYQGNWWLAYQGSWLGYYPGSLYRGGQLTRFAQLIEFGTESVGTTIWPPEGSGHWSTSGFRYAANQRNLFYVYSGGATAWDRLTRYDPSPRCYSTSGPFSSPSSGWQVYFYVGGPGGTGC